VRVRRVRVSGVETPRHKAEGVISSEATRSREISSKRPLDKLGVTNPSSSCLCALVVEFLSGFDKSRVAAILSA